MTSAVMGATPAKTSYDVVIVGGAIMGSSAAWFLSGDPDFDGSVLVVERDPSYENCSTAHTNSCMRQQYSAEINVRVSQFAAQFVKNLREWMGGDERVPQLAIRSFGYMFLAADAAFAQVLRESHAVQVAAGAGTRLMTPEDIAREFPFYELGDVVLGSHNPVDEGYWDGAAVFDHLRRSARKRGVEYVADEVVAMTRNAAGTRVESVTLKSGATVACGQVLNASGPRAALTARMAGIELPVEPRKRYSWLFRAERPLDRDLPLTIDPSGVHVREAGGGTYQCGGVPEDDRAVAPDDFEMDHAMWEAHVWPTIAARIPQFEAVRVISGWAGHYAWNSFDHNAVLGPHDLVENFHFLNGFSGHGLQQSPAMGRAMSELLAYGEFRTIDMTPLGYERIAAGRPIRARSGRLADPVGSAATCSPGAAVPLDSVKLRSGE